MKGYRFSLGNSDDDAVGFCISVEANSQHEAEIIFRQSLSWATNGVRVLLDEPALSNGVLFINVDNVTVDAIAECENETSD